MLVTTGKYSDGIDSLPLLDSLAAPINNRDTHDSDND